jgi:MATE family multidrug resistance protein
MAAQVAVAALGLIDTLTFGWFGTGALAGGGLGTAVFSLVHIVCVGVLMAVGNQVAYADGAGDQEAVRDAVRAGLIVAIALGTVAGAGLAFGGHSAGRMLDGTDHD